MPSDFFDRLAVSRGKKAGARGLKRAASSLDPIEDGPVLSRSTSRMDTMESPRLTRASSPLDERETPIRGRDTSVMDRADRARYPNKQHAVSIKDLPGGDFTIESPSLESVYASIQEDLDRADARRFQQEVDRAKADYSSARGYSGPIPSTAPQLLPGGQIIMGMPDLPGLQKAIQEELDRDDERRYRNEERRWKAEQRDYQRRKWGYQDFQRQLGLEDRDRKQRQEDVGLLMKLPEFARRTQQLGMPGVGAEVARQLGIELPAIEQRTYPGPVPKLEDYAVSADLLPIPQDIRKQHPQLASEFAHQLSQVRWMAGEMERNLPIDATDYQRFVARSKVANETMNFYRNVMYPEFERRGIKVTEVPKTSPELLLRAKEFDRKYGLPPGTTLKELRAEMAGEAGPARHPGASTGENLSPEAAEFLNLWGSL